MLSVANGLNKSKQTLEVLVPETAPILNQLPLAVVPDEVTLGLVLELVPDLIQEYSAEVLSEPDTRKRISSSSDAALLSIEKTIL